MNSSTGASRPHTPANAALQAAATARRITLRYEISPGAPQRIPLPKEPRAAPTTPEAHYNLHVGLRLFHLDGAPGSSHVTIRGKHRYPTRKCSHTRSNRGMQKAVRCTVVPVAGPPWTVLERARIQRTT